MFKYSCLIILILLSFFNRAKAQQPVPATHHEQERAAMGFSAEDYNAYIKGLRDYGRQLIAVRNNPSLSDSAKSKAIKELHARLQMYQQQHLTTDQLQRLRQMEEANQQAMGMRHQKQLAELKAHQAHHTHQPGSAANDTLH